MIRLGMTIGIHPEKIEEYKQLHKDVWPEILKNLEELNCRNYSIFINKSTLFGYMEYIGDDYQRDMRLMAQNEKVKEWWKLCSLCQIPDEKRKKGEWWSIMEEIFHHP